MKIKTAVLILFYGIIVISLAMAFLGFDMHKIDLVVPWFISIGVGLIFSAIAGSIIEASGLGFLKMITINVPVWNTGLYIPITLFTIATLLLKAWLF